MTWTTIAEDSLPALYSHELRWGRTVRALAPVGYLASSIQLPLLWLTLAVVLQPHASWPFILFLWCYGFRAVAAFVMDRCVGQRSLVPLLLLAPRDWLSAIIMASSMTGTRVDWRGHTMHVSGHVTGSTHASPVNAIPPPISTGD